MPEKSRETEVVPGCPVPASGRGWSFLGRRSRSGWNNEMNCALLRLQNRLRVVY